MKNIYLGYNKRSCVTGKALFNYLKENLPEGFSARRVFRKKPSKKPFMFIRWGNSMLDSVSAEIELNANSSNASDKGVMMERFLDAEVNTPDVLMLDDGIDIEDFKEKYEVEKLYFRNAHDQIKLRGNPVEGDKYVLEPIEKDKEYRVHIMFGRTVGVYEKIPYEGEDGAIRKDDNCQFRRIDFSNKDQKEEAKGVRPAARAAISALELDFGGVDVIKSEDGEILVLEVNSSPSLNTENIIRWGDKLIEHAINKSSGSDTQEQEENTEQPIQAN